LLSLSLITATMVALGWLLLYTLCRQAAAPLLHRLREVVLLPARGGRVPFPALARALGARGLTTLLIEGGGTVAAEALRARTVDRLILFLAPELLGAEGVPAIGPLGLRRIADAVGVEHVAVARVGRDLVVEGGLRYPRT